MLRFIVICYKNNLLVLCCVSLCFVLSFIALWCVLLYFIALRLVRLLCLCVPFSCVAFSCFLCLFRSVVLCYFKLCFVALCHVVYFFVCFVACCCVLLFCKHCLSINTSILCFLITGLMPSGTGVIGPSGVLTGSFSVGRKHVPSDNYRDETSDIIQHWT